MRWRLMSVANTVMLEESWLL